MSQNDDKSPDALLNSHAVSSGAVNGFVRALRQSADSLAQEVRDRTVDQHDTEGLTGSSCL